VTGNPLSRSSPAALSRPHAEVWILFGHGACGYSLAEFDTFVRHGIQIIAV
jgi:thiamine pyrophosphate-dependent acetolactate synthase large subunit-like protein